MTEFVDERGVARWPERLNLAEYFVDSNLAAGRSGAIALSCRDEVRTYGRLAERTARMAAGLRRLGVRPEERVLICLSDGFEFAETFFGVLRAGAVFAMVNPLSKADALEYYLRYTKARVAVVDEAILPEMAVAFERVATCEELMVVGGRVDEYVAYEDVLDAADPDSPFAEVEPTGPDDLAGWLFTSGSTGNPKACVHMQSDFVYSTETYARRVVQYNEHDVCLGVPKLFFGYATGTNLMFPLRFGGTAALFPARSTADELFDEIARVRPTILTSVPTMIGNMLRSPRIESADLSSLRVTLSAGEALPASLYSEWKQRAGVEILDGIGAAETFHIYISNRLDDVKLGSLGRLVEGYQAEIVNDAGERLADDEIGRLRVRGESIALCYWADKRKSREAFQGDWFTSADVFRRDAEGYFYYEGRSDDLIKVSGIWVSPLEIENALLAHPSVAEVCVVPKPDESNLIKPLAFIVCASGAKAGATLETELKAHVKSLLTPHKYPRWFEFRDALPKNDRGKVARKVLRSELEGAST